jgi:predicted GNAT family acetyltransferase
MADDANVKNNEAEHRYELAVDGLLATSEYERRGNEIVFLHTQVPDALEGHGVGSALARGALDDARANGLTVVPLCPFIRAYIARHREYLDIVEPHHRARIEQGA